MAVIVEDDYDGRKIISSLDAEFRRNLKVILGREL